MIMLTAIRLDAYDRFQYRIEAPELVPVVMSNAEAVASLLLQLGVKNPQPLIEHARTWGTVEIAET
jgi:hypothetical protein